MHRMAQGDSSEQSQVEGADDQHEESNDGVVDYDQIQVELDEDIDIEGGSNNA